jgi:hypothetical protein
MPLLAWPVENVSINQLRSKPTINKKHRPRKSSALFAVPSPASERGFLFCNPLYPIKRLMDRMSAMDRRTLLQSIPAAALLGKIALADPAAPSTMVYELRIYHTFEGKLDDLLARFRDHTMKLFEKHGMKNVAYWTPTDDPQKGKTLVYILAHPSREAATANWDAFRNDPGWVSVRDKSEANGKIVEKVDSTYMTMTDFSPKL